MSAAYTDKNGKVWACEELEVGDEIEYVKPHKNEAYQNVVVTEVTASQYTFLLDNGYSFVIERRDRRYATRFWNITKRNGKPYIPAGMAQWLPTKDQAVAAEHVVTAPPGGCVCKRCNMFNDCAAPNQKDGSYLCYECR